MASLRTRVADLATRISTEFRTVKVFLGGASTFNLDGTALTTTAKNVLGAINELDAAVDAAAASGGAQNLDQLTDVVINAPAAGHIIRHNGTNFVNVDGSTIYQIKDADLDAIAALAGQTNYGRNFLTLADQAALMALMPSASTTVKGPVLLASNAEAVTGTDNLKAITAAALAAAIAGKANTSALSAVATSGNAADLTGTLSTAQLPPLAINEVFDAASQAAMLALTAQRGDIAIRSDLGKMFVLKADAPGTLANWVELVAAGNVLSVAGKTGAVTLSKADVGLSNVDNTSDANKPISTATQTALNNKQNLDATLTALAGLAVAADQMIYATGSDAFALTTLTTFARSLLDDATAADARNTLDVYGKADIGNPDEDFVTIFNNALNA